MPQEKIEYILRTESGRPTVIWDEHSLDSAKRYATKVGKTLYKRTTTFIDEVVE